MHLFKHVRLGASDVIYDEHVTRIRVTSAPKCLAQPISVQLFKHVRLDALSLGARDITYEEHVTRIPVKST